jgi:hypothetical protein
MLGGPHLGSMMPKVSDRISVQVLEAHRGPEAGRVPPGGIVHRQRPVTRREAVNLLKKGAVHLVESTDDSFAPKPSCPTPRTDRVDPVKEWCGEIEDPCEHLGANDREPTKENMETSESPNDYEAQQDVKEDLTVRPA